MTRSLPGPRSRSRARTSSDVPTGTEAELLDKLDHGDPEALAELYRRHGMLVFAVASRVGGAEVAAEVTRAVFLQLRADPRAFRDGDVSLRTYLLTQAQNAAVDLLQGTTPPSPNSSDNIASLSDLPEAESSVLALIVFGGCTFREASVLLDVPEWQVQRWAASGFRALGNAHHVRP